MTMCDYVYTIFFYENIKKRDSILDVVNFVWINIFKNQLFIIFVNR